MCMLSPFALFKIKISSIYFLIYTNLHGNISFASQHLTTTKKLTKPLNFPVDTCKKRWKYLRERYVSQRKQSDPPVYEHLSRPYLEKMKFLDQHIQPRKSYRNVSNFLASPHAGGSSYADFNMDSSRSNGSMKNSYPNYHDSMFVGNSLTDPNGPGGSATVKTEPEQAFREFAAALASQQTPQPPFYNHIPASVSSSSSLKSPQSSSCSGNNDNSDLNTSDTMTQQKKPRVQNDDILNSTPFQQQQQQPQQQPPATEPSTIGNNNFASTVNNEPLDSSDDNECIDEPPDIVPSHVSAPNHHPAGGSAPNHHHHNNLNGRSSHNSHENLAAAAAAAATFHNNDYLFQLAQQMPPNLRQIRSSEQLVGELVTAELLKMSKDRRKTVQKKILGILFFDD